MALKVPQLLEKSEIRVLSKAPIREAILQIQFKTGSDFDIVSLAKIKESLPAEFANFNELKSTKIEFKVDAKKFESTTGSTDTIEGYRAQDGSQCLTAIFRANDFTFSMLEPYSNWNDFRRQARELWDIFRNELPDIEFSRAALRYINEISIPYHNDVPFEFKDYLTTPLEIPEKLGETIEGFFSRVIIPFPDQRVKVVSINSFQEIVDNYVRIILDNDVYRENIDALTEDELWELLETLRVVKDTVFFANLTDKSLEIFS